MPSSISPVDLIKDLSDPDRRIVKAAYAKQFPKARKSRYRDCLHTNNFSAIEKNFLSKLFIEENGAMVLDYSDKMMELIS